jgi:hypothetical protein
LASTEGDFEALVEQDSVGKPGEGVVAGLVGEVALG